LRKHAWLFVLGGLAIALAMAGVADAYWTATGTGGGSGPVGTLNAPTISSATPGAGTATLTWSAVTPPGSGSVSYYVQRNGGSPVGNCPTQAAPTSVLTCTDSGLAKGTYTYTVTAVWRSWTVTSSPAQVTLASGAPHHFVLSAATTTPTAGQADNLTITAVDAAGNTVIGYTGSHSLTFSGAGTIGSFSPTVTNKSGAAINFGTATAITFANGVAAVSAGSNGAMTLYKAGTVTVSVTDTSISGTSASITIGAAAANKLSFTQSPGDTTAGVAFASQPKVTVQDQYGNTVTSDTSSVTIAVTGGAATLSGCAANPTAATAGVATFGGCTITTAGTYTLTATDGSLTSAVSGSFTIGPAAANKLSFTQSPGNTVAGVAFASQPQVTVQDQYGNTVTSDTSSVTIAVTGGAATLSGCAANPKPATAGSSGVVTFSGCKITTVGTAYQLHATDGSLTAADSTAFNITPGAAKKLSFTQSPGNTVAGVAFASQPKVTVQDQYGNTVTTDTSSGDAERLCREPEARHGWRGDVQWLQDHDGRHLHADCDRWVADLSRERLLHHHRGHQHLPGQAGDLLIDRTSGLCLRLRGRWQRRHPLVVGVQRSAVDLRRSGSVPQHHPGGADVGDRLRQIVPDPDVQRPHQLDHDLFDYDRDRWHPDPQQQQRTK
jgi:phosphoribosylcarboxyaminoimidazole (NCAIR) mutase